MSINGPLIARILSADRIEEQPLRGQSLVITEDMIPFPRNRRGARTLDSMEVELTEAPAALGQLNTANFPDLLRQGLNFLSMASYAGEPVVYPEIVGAETASSKQQEEYLLDSTIGSAPVVPEGTDYPAAALKLDAGVTVKNYKYGFNIPVTEEMRRFDQVGKVQQLAELAGRSLRITEEDAVLTALTTAGNFTHSNTAATTFSSVGIKTAYEALAEQTDSAGNFLGVRPDTLVCTPGVYLAALQLFRSTSVVGTTAATVYGLGSTNPFYGFVDTIIVTPRLGSSYQWLLGQRGRGLKFQRVDAARVLPPEFYPENDVWKYFARTWFGFGILDDRYWYYSSSVTTPALA